jgi:hypothetical protein
MIVHEDVLGWHRLTDSEQAQLRFALMREMSWIDWDGQPSWWWEKTHVHLLELKTACALPRQGALGERSHGHL